MSIKRLALGTRKGILILRENGGKWSVEHESFRGVHVSIVHLDKRNGDLFACLDDGHFGNKLFRWSGFQNESDWQSKSQDDVWQELETPKYPDGMKLHNGKDAVLTYQWAMANGSENQPGRIYIGSEPGGLFVSNDSGDSFEFCQTLWDHPSRTDEKTPWMGGGRDEAAIHSICIDPRDESRCIVGVSVAGVFRSDDNLQSWRGANKGLKADFLPDPDSEYGQDPHLVVQCESNPDVLWQQNHCGIFRSVDCGENWEGVSEEGGPANFGFAVAVDPNDGDVAWVVPAESDMVRVACDNKMVVCRTEDGGKSWTAFGNGLPSEGCYDFAFRHCLQLSGNTVVFGTVGGILYLSADRGENWQPIASHLPPIYCHRTRLSSSRLAIFRDRSSG